MMTKLDAKMIGQFRNKYCDLRLNIYNDGTYQFRGTNLNVVRNGRMLVVQVPAIKRKYWFDLLKEDNELQSIMNSLALTRDFEFYMNDEKYRQEKTIRQLKKMILETKLLIKNTNDLK